MSGWNGVMEIARRQATMSGQRAKVVAAHATGRMARIIGSNYVYVVLTPELPWDPRCGKLSPLGKPCVKRTGYSHGVYHLSRDLAPKSFTYWTPTDWYGHPTREFTGNGYEIHPTTEADVKEMGLL